MSIKGNNKMNNKVADNHNHSHNLAMVKPVVAVVDVQWVALRMLLCFSGLCLQSLHLQGD